MLGVLRLRSVAGQCSTRRSSRWMSHEAEHEALEQLIKPTMRQLYRKVHPDLFVGTPHQRVNEQSLQTLHTALEQQRAWAVAWRNASVANHPHSVADLLKLKNAKHSIVFFYRDHTRGGGSNSNSSSVSDSEGNRIPSPDVNYCKVSVILQPLEFERTFKDLLEQLRIPPPPAPVLNKFSVRAQQEASSSFTERQRGFSFGAARKPMHHASASSRKSELLDFIQHAADALHKARTAPQYAQHADTGPNSRQDQEKGEQFSDTITDSAWIQLLALRRARGVYAHFDESIPHTNLGFRSRLSARLNDALAQIHPMHSTCHGQNPHEILSGALICLSATSETSLVPISTGSGSDRKETGLVLARLGGMASLERWKALLGSSELINACAAMRHDAKVINEMEISAALGLGVKQVFLQLDTGNLGEAADVGSQGEDSALASVHFRRVVKSARHADEYQRFLKSLTLAASKSSFAHSMLSSSLRQCSLMVSPSRQGFLDPKGAEFLAHAAHGVFSVSLVCTPEQVLDHLVEHADEVAAVHSHRLREQQRIDAAAHALGVRSIERETVDSTPASRPRSAASTDEQALYTVSEREFHGAIQRIKRVAGFLRPFLAHTRLVIGRQYALNVRERRITIPHDF
ncbi:hypothetical protein FVE85_5548 [Porphyridium purpureum]|uniref:DUF4460 domain-containing protein n=1 Tax=Porphyridium purpureum TaxID=35688 RepID=A0A5J4Z4W3_PORPP|nr:hypothetical protein FVE85_5548 [Porphyridium purpureum]|eukprot:POR2470..scf295_1